MSYLRRFGPLLAALVLVAAVSAGGEEEGGDEKRPEQRKMAFRWEVEASYPDLGSEKIGEKLKEWLSGYIADSVAEAKELADLEETKGFWDLWIDYSFTRPSDKAVSVIFETYTYPYGAAHPSGHVVAKNYLVESAEELTLDSLFRDPDKALAIFAENAPRIVSEDFMKNHADEFPDGLPIDDLFAEGFKPTRDNYDTLGLEEDGVRVIFQQYQVLPYVFGMPSPLIPLSLLEPAGPNREVWQK